MNDSDERCGLTRETGGLPGPFREGQRAGVRDVRERVPVHRGGFYGPDHAETAGVFEKAGIVASFGAGLD